MPASALRRTDDPPTYRDKLRYALQALNEEQERLTQLERGQARCHDQVRTAFTAQQNAEERLRLHQPNEAALLVDAYLSDQILDAGSTLKDLEGNVARTTQEHARLEQVEAALNGQIEQSQRRMQDRHRQVHIALSDLLCDSPELHQLFQALDDAWARICGIRKAFDQITTALHGQMPSNQLNRWQVSPPLDYHVLGFPIDESPANAWQLALERLLGGDADAPLPSIS
jgi:hypothetical protein